MQRWRVTEILAVSFVFSFLLKTSHLSPSATINLLDQLLQLGLRGAVYSFFLIHLWHALHAQHSLLQRMVKDAGRTPTPRPIIIGLYIVTAVSTAIVILIKL